MKIKDILLGPNGLLRPDIQERSFDRIHYGVLARAVGLRYEMRYSPAADARIKAYLVDGTMRHPLAFNWHDGYVVYLLDGELAAFSWKDCNTGPAHVRFFSQDLARGVRNILHDALFAHQEVETISLDAEFKKP